MAPKMKDFLDEESVKFYENVKSYLTELNVPFYENESLVRGLDYYSDTVFEIWDRSLGSQNAVGGGGRYELGKALGNAEAIPAFGMAMGAERIMGHMEEAGINVPSKDTVDVFVAQLGNEAKKKAIKIATDLRDFGIHAIGGMGKSSMKAQLKMADKRNVPWTIILGEVEVREGIAIIRDMKEGKQVKVAIEDLYTEIINKIGKENIDHYKGE